MMCYVCIYRFVYMCIVCICMYVCVCVYSSQRLMLSLAQSLSTLFLRQSVSEPRATDGRGICLSLHLGL